MLRYFEPPPGRVDLETYNAGNAHLCLTVDDWDATVARLKELDASFHREAPVWQTAGEFEGTGTLYLRDPDGITVELDIPARWRRHSRGVNAGRESSAPAGGAIVVRHRLPSAACRKAHA